ncbi:hypothetical protein BDD12DRAFT_810588 [Trichophaea hybrida]|nr:hypothetical protein BDD12DRAFT_810588 [Trichophaea hybrida]
MDWKSEIQGVKQRPTVVHSNQQKGSEFHRMDRFQSENCSNCLKKASGIVYAPLGEFDYSQPDAVYQELLALEEHELYLRRIFSLKALNFSPVVSLDRLISCSPGKLEPLSCCQIPTNLMKSVLSFYASPWIRDWTLDTIQCYGKSANPFQELWIPHVPVKFSSNVGSRNREAHVLGLILLQLGRKQRLDDNNEVYPELVEKRIWTWGQGNLDLMEEENLKKSLLDIEKLEKLLVNFTPRTQASGVVV